MRKRPVFGSGSRNLDACAANTPVLDLRDYLSGHLSASGVFFGPFGRPRRHFTMDMEGRWDGNLGTLDEHFRYDNGETGQRCWNLNFANDGTFTATAHDVRGTATGIQRGNAARMQYRLRVMRTGGAITVGMEDWFYLMDDGTLINRARMSKFGIKVGELVVSFRRHDAGGQPGPQAGTS